MTANARDVMGKEGPAFTVHRNSNQCSHSGHQYEESSKKLNIEPGIPLHGMSPKHLTTAEEFVLITMGRK